MSTKKILENLENIFTEQALILTRENKEYFVCAEITQYELLKRVNLLKKLLPQIAEDIGKNPIKKGNLPILIVVKGSLTPLTWQVAACYEDRSRYITHFDNNKFYNIGVQIPQGEIYLAVDVDDGKSMQGELLTNDKFKKIERSPLIMEEGLSLVQCLGREILKYFCYSLVLFGSRYNEGKYKDYWMPVLHAEKNGDLKVGFSYSRCGDSRYGVPSCRSRIGL